MTKYVKIIRLKLSMNLTNTKVDRHPLLKLMAWAKGLHLDLTQDLVNKCLPQSVQGLNQDQV